MLKVNFITRKVLDSFHGALVSRVLGLGKVSVTWRAANKGSREGGKQEAGRERGRARGLAGGWPAGKGQQEAGKLGRGGGGVGTETAR